MASLYRSRWLIAYGNFIFHYRNKVFPAVLAVMLVAFLPRHIERSEGWDFVADVTAVVVALLGETIRTLTVGLEYIKRGGLNKRIYADHLVQEGIFAHCRNPLYVGNILLATALLSIPDVPALFVIGTVLTVITYVAVVAAEEKFLREKFGTEFDAYCRRVNRWIPNPRGIGATIRSMSFNWRRVLLKEFTSFYGWIVLACVLDGIEIRFTDVLNRPSFVMFLTLFVVATLAFMAIRILKQSHKLRLDP